MNKLHNFFRSENCGGYAFYFFKKGNYIHTHIIWRFQCTKYASQLTNLPFLSRIWFLKPIFVPSKYS